MEKFLDEKDLEEVRLGIAEQLKGLNSGLLLFFCVGIAGAYLGTNQQTYIGSALLMLGGGGFLVGWIHLMKTRNTYQHWLVGLEKKYISNILRGAHLTEKAAEISFYAIFNWSKDPLEREENLQRLFQTLAHHQTDRASNQSVRKMIFDTLTEGQEKRFEQERSNA